MSTRAGSTRAAMDPTLAEPPPDPEPAPEPEPSPEPDPEPLPDPDPLLLKGLNPLEPLEDAAEWTERQTPWPIPSPTRTATTSRRAVTIPGRLRRGVLGPPPDQGEDQPPPPGGPPALPPPQP